jgi:hypothetical protein
MLSSSVGVVLLAASSLSVEAAVVGFPLLGKFAFVLFLVGERHERAVREYAVAVLDGRAVRASSFRLSGALSVRH